MKMIETRERRERDERERRKRETREKRMLCAVCSEEDQLTAFYLDELFVSGM